MKQQIVERIGNLREQMKKKGLDVWLINGSDPHMSEYVPERWQTRAWISGFTGSFGWLAITDDKAALWTDSRYFLQAGEQLEGTGIDMEKVRVPDAVTTEDWLVENLNVGAVIGFDASCYSMSEIENLKKVIEKAGLKLKPTSDLLDDIWDDRPAYPESGAFLHAEEWAGKSRVDKIKAVEDKLAQKKADLTILSALDDVCWTLNIRGADVECNPVVLAFAIIGKGTRKLYINSQKLSSEELDVLKNDGLEILSYEKFYTDLGLINNKVVVLDPIRSNFRIVQLLGNKNEIINHLSLPALMKASKNENEIAGMKRAHLTDALALLDFQMWLEDRLDKETITEYDVARKLMDFRSKYEGYVGPSFFPIVAYRDHGAIVHFRVTPDNANTLKRNGILLFDSGGQYLFGTTDITRTLALGETTLEMRRDYTLVLKGMIRLSKVKFPKGIHGCHLDVLAREALWAHNLNYGHGTGHGVGAFMNVHEGPGSIRPDLNNQQLMPGNVFSNEPGMYRTGEYGIRIENLIYVVEDEENDFGSFLRFETLTVYPIDTKLIDTILLDPEEVRWINEYHNFVFQTLGSHTNKQQKELLERLTKPI